MRKMLIFLCLFLICFSSTAYAVDYTRYVDTGSSGGDGTTAATAGVNAAYASLFAAEAAMDGVAGAGETVTFHLNRTNGGGEDTTPVVFAGWNATAIVVIVQDDFPSNGIPDGTKYVFHNNDTDIYGIDVNMEYFTANMQIKVTETSTNDRIGIGFRTLGATNSLLLDKCIVWGACSGTGTAYGIFVNDSDAVITIRNCIVHGFISGADSGFRGILENTATTVSCFNNTIRNCYYGIVRTASTMSSTNNALFDNANDHVGTITMDHCATDEGAGEDTAGGDGVNISATWNTTCFTDETTHDYHVQDALSPLYGTGFDLSGTFTDDIVGTVRSSWDIGAYEFVASGGSIVPILYNLENQ